MSRVYRRTNIEGTEIPGIIHNGNYFFDRLGVYEDGVVSCWKMSDLDQFREDLNRGWVVPAIPHGETLSVFELGDFRTEEALWQFDADGFYDHVVNTVKQMNPKMENIYHTSERELEKRTKRRFEPSATAVPYKLRGNFGYTVLNGESIHIFYREGVLLYLTALTAYADETLRIDKTGEHEYTFEEIKDMFQTGRLCTAPKPGEWTIIKGLGELLLVPEDSQIDPQEKLQQIEERIKSVSGRETAHNRCMAAYYQYLIQPGDWQRERLREAYEAIPESERMYLGDMDSRDGDFIRILYEPWNKRQV